MQRLLIPGGLLVMFIASNEILSMTILLGFGIWFIAKIMEEY